jgi:hypothetical protein
MNNQNRDLLVITKNIELSTTELEETIINLDTILFAVENQNSFCIANEIIDINRYKIYSKPNQVSVYINNNKIKPFVFIFNKN